MTSSTSTFKELPAPWTIKGPKAWWMLTSLGFPTWSSPAKLSDEHFYNSESNKDPFQGGTGMVQILRYSDTPAGSQLALTYRAWHLLPPPSPLI